MPTDDDGILSRLKKKAKKKKAKAKAKRNKRQRKRTTRRRKLRQKKESAEEFAGDVAAIAGASRAGGAAKATAKGAKAASRGAARVEKGIQKVAENTAEARLRRGDMTVGELKNMLEFTNNVSKLDRMLRAERSGKNRKSARDAIKDRKKELQGNGKNGVGSMGFGPPEDDFFGGEGPTIDDPVFEESSGGSGKDRDSFGLDF